MATFGFRLIVAGPPASRWAMSALSTAETRRSSVVSTRLGWHPKSATGRRCRTNDGRLRPAATFTLEGEIQLSAIHFFVRLVPNGHEVTQSLDSGSTAKELHTTRSTPTTIQRQSAARGFHTDANHCAVQRIIVSSLDSLTYTKHQSCTGTR
jgi:hypothetical protein